MKILNLQASNLKRIVAIEVTPDGAVVEITGRNRQGKTSLLDAIWWLITGGNNVQSQPIRSGETEAVIVGVLGDDGSDKRLKVTRTFKLKRTELAKIAEGEEPDPTEWATTLKIENEDGFAAGKPQEMLDGLIGSLAFDPLAFLHAKAKDQVVMLRDLLKLDFTEIDTAIKTAFDERTGVNRETESYQAQANAILIPADAPEEAINVDDLIAALDEAGQTNIDIERQQSARRQEAQSIVRAEETLEADNSRLTAERARIAEAITAADALEERLKTDEDSITERKKKLEGVDQIPDPVDTADLRQQIADARVVNEAVAQRTRKAELQQKATDSKAKADALTAAIDEKKAEKAKLLAESNMPVEGLSFGEDGVTLDGLPFDQASDAQQLETSIAIAATMNPKLRVIRVREGDKLDSDAFKRLVTYAEKNDLQVWLETIESSRSGAVVIEDGRVLGADQDEQPSLV